MSVESLTAPPTGRRTAPRLTLADVMRNQAKTNPHRPALTAQGREYSYAELHAITNRLASGLAEAGVRRGDTVAVLGSNSVEHVLLQHAVAKLGAALAVLNWRQSEDEVAYAVELCRPRLVFAQPAYRHLVTATQRPVEPVSPRGESDFYERFVDPFAADEPTADVDAEDLVTIICTSGTTGRPKAAAISHRAMIARAAFAASDMRLGADDAHLAWAPMFHLVSADYIFVCAVLGSRYIVVDGFDVEAINEYLHQVRLGWFVMMPGAIGTLIERLRQDDRPVKPIRLVGAMADLVPPEQVRELTSLLGTSYYNSYGMTEAGPLTYGSIAPGTYPDHLGKRFTALANHRLVRADGTDAELGEPGEMLVSGPTLFTCYLHDEEATNASLVDGWYRTGDLLRADEDGFLHFVGRTKYLIKSGGENVYPAEIERVLMACPGVVEVVVVRRPDPRWGEIPVAFVATDRPVETGDLEAACRRELAGYKVPKVFRYIELDQIPRNVTGKVVRERLEAWV
ncbi:class I adenylate-forming enzyme family protein [Streptomyces abyssomicinicus]|uniref:class I adenylate-forming enzyme family protein n=1 Tax=Streptomyces abyssomicinicus TaxID=574929 RepID=UPI001250BE8F|nr:AMP-binding protein [Streptomyces abyssomicinicus]